MRRPPTPSRFVAALLFIVITLSIACTHAARCVLYGQLEILPSKI
jgi:hypothetical protein